MAGFCLNLRMTQELAGYNKTIKTRLSMKNLRNIKPPSDDFDF